MATNNSVNNKPTVGDGTSNTTYFNGTNGNTLTATAAGFTLQVTSNGSGGGGHASLTGGASTASGWQGGDASLIGGTSLSFTGGGAIIAGGATSGGGGGPVFIIGGASTSGGEGGSITLIPGLSASGWNGNNVTINGGPGQTNVACGGVNIIGGTGGSGCSGGESSLVGGSGNANIGGDALITGGISNGSNQRSPYTKITSGNGTGNGHVGQIEFIADASGNTSGSSQNTQVHRLYLNGAQPLTSGAAHTIASATLASNSMSGGHINYTVESSDGTDFQVTSGVMAFCITNKAALISGTASLIGLEVTNATLGTLTNTFAVDASGNIQITPTVSVITPTTLRVTYTVFCNSQQEITIP